MLRRTRDSVEDVWGPRTPFAGEGRWPERVDERLDDEPDRWVQSCCVLCSNGCALDVGVKDGRIVGVRGRAADRANRGRLGPKGLNGWVANHSPDRLTRPLVRDGGRLREASWDEAMGLVVERAKQALAETTPSSVAFYNTGQLFIEAYYTLSVIAHAGVGTDQLDGNTRLCTATASDALRESFGADGQPASYADLDVTDCVLLAGSNPAENQTVWWMRLLDRKAGPNPPKLVVIDPRRTPTAREADVHLRPRLGTNVALLNGLLHLVIEAGHVDQAFIDKHTQGFQRLADTVRDYPPRRVREITGVPEDQLRAAAEIVGTAPTLVSACLQGVYQSNQATAAACQVNNLHLIRGMIGKPGCGVFQMNGQPTSQNTRETGCDGEFPFFLNWQNPDHVERWAKLWNVDPLRLPAWHLHAHALEIFRHAELGSVKFLWIICTNPAVSLPELHKVRRTLAKPDLFVVVQDAFLTETAQLADVVLPAAIWGEKTGTFTNADRTVHISYKAVEPPGEAKPDLDIFLDFAKRMNFRDKSNRALIKWKDAEGAFKHWAKCSRGWLVDYSGLTYAKLTGGSGVQWPCNRKFPNGRERLYTDHKFPTAADVTQTFGHDLETGAAIPPEDYRAEDPAGRAVIKSANYIPPLEEPDAEYPFFLTTGRVVYQFHTRTKTARSKELQQAAPEPFVQIHPDDAAKLGVADGEAVEVASRRGTVRVPARVTGDVLPGHLFIPFHYGYWDAPDADHDRAANELTITGWDPVSKQPQYKYAAVQVRKVPGTLTDVGRAVADAASKAVDTASELADKVLSSAHPPRQHVPDAIGRLRASHRSFATACRDLKSVHTEEAELVAGWETLARWSDDAAAALGRFADRYGEQLSDLPENLRKTLFPAPRPGAVGVLEDLHALAVLASDAQVGVAVVQQAAKILHDADMLDTALHVADHTKRQHQWLMTHVKHRSPHTLTVPA